MKSNPSPKWTLAERLNIIAEISSFLNENRLAVIPNVAFAAVKDIALIATQPAEILEKRRKKILALSYTSADYLSYVRSGVKYFIITTKTDWSLIDGSKQRLPRTIRVNLPPGRHQFERIANPYPRAEPDYLALRGTQIGCAESYWRSFEDEEHGIRQVVIEDDTENATASTEDDKVSI